MATAWDADSSQQSLAPGASPDLKPPAEEIHVETPVVAHPSELSTDSAGVKGAGVVAGAVTDDKVGTSDSLPADVASHEAGVRGAEDPEAGSGAAVAEGGAPPEVSNFPTVPKELQSNLGEISATSGEGVVSTLSDPVQDQIIEGSCRKGEQSCAAASATEAPKDGGEEAGESLAIGAMPQEILKVDGLSNDDLAERAFDDDEEEIPQWTGAKSKRRRNSSKPRLLDRIIEFLNLLWESTIGYLYDWLIRSEAGRAKKRLAAARESLQSLEEAMGLLKRQEAMDWGPPAFRALYGRCVTSRLLGYLYTVCPYDKTEQKENGELHKKTYRLGSFRGWHAPAMEQGHAVMLFAGGESCGDVDRRALVRTECGEFEAIVAASETQKCLYDLTLTTPAACKAEEVAARRAKLEAHEAGVLALPDTAPLMAEAGKR